MSKIHQEITIDASPEKIFDLLTISDLFAKCTESKAEIDPSVGGKFSCFDGMITGQTIESVPGERLIQAWRAGNWEEGIYSIVRFELCKKSETKTLLIFDHTGYPAEHEGHLIQGWNNKYWTPMKEYLCA